MALASGRVVDTWMKITDATQAAVTLEANIKVALFNDTPTPNFTQPIAYGAGQFTTANELTSGLTWPEGGLAVTNPNISIQTVNGIPCEVWECDDISASPVTFVDAAGALFYIDSTSPKYGLVVVKFPTPVSVTNGTLLLPIQSAAAGGLWRVTAHA